MSDWMPRLIILALLSVVLGVPFAFRPSEATIPVPKGMEDQLVLVILSPHSEQIRHEFSTAFNRWRQSQGLPPVRFDWRSSGGTSDLRKQLLDEFLKAAMNRREDQVRTYDLFFGGGDVEHDTLARGITIERDGKPVVIMVTLPISLPPGLLESAFPQPVIGSDRLYHPDLQWIGVALSSFGIVYNNDLLGMLGLPEPSTWADLQDPRYQHWLALTDPGKSGSAGATYNAVLRRLGWTQGWSVLRRVYANSRYFTASANKVPVDVSAGEAAAGMCIDFYGRFQAGAVGGSRVGYVDPAFMTAITADPISIVRGAPHRELAEQFVAWLLSPQAQSLWQRKLDATDGPDKFELRRLPIRRDMYTSGEMAHWVDQVNPFEIASPFPAGMPDFYRTVALITHAIAIDIHADLRAAWKAINEERDESRKAKMLELFDRMPEPLTLVWPDAELEQHWQTILQDASHPRNHEVAGTLKAFMDNLRQRWAGDDQRLNDRLQFTLFFRDNYREIVRLSQSK